MLPVVLVVKSEGGISQVWLEFAVKCDYVDRNEAAKLYKTYDEVLGTFVGMINHKEKWILSSKK